jgi:hypothetical protein
LIVGRRQLQSVKPEVQLQLNLTVWASWWILPMAKNSQRCKKMLQGGRKWRKKMQEEGSREWKLNHRQCRFLTLGLDQITKFVYHMDGPLGEGNV